MLFAIVGLPYSRVDPRAFAELYHGSTDTTGQFHMAIDCDTSTVATDASCVISSEMTSVSVDVTIANSTGSDALLAAFNVEISNPDTTRLDAQDPACSEPKTNCNPNFLDSAESADGLASPGWTCDPALADMDSNNANGDVSLIACFDPATSDNLAQGSEHTDLARVTYDLPITSTQGSVALALQNVNVFDETISELISCNPVATQAGSCFGASVSIGFNPYDEDADGIPNYADNCPFYWNPGQENTDGDFISAQGLHVDDYSLANSDGLGDGCDPDEDNDGLSDMAEWLPQGACPATDPWLLDTDGDRVTDGAECTLGTDPTNPAAKPSPTACAAHLGVAVTADTDGDRLKDYLEFCGYGTDPTDANTDFLPGSDGCEAISLNNDLKVNSGDQLLLLQEYLRLPPPAKLANYDLNKDGPINSGDQLLMLQFFGTCP